MYTGAALSFGLIRACRSGLVLCCSVLSDAGGENDRSSAIFERSLLHSHMNNSSSFLSTKPWLPLNTLLHKLHKHGQTCFVRCSRRGNLDNHYADSPDNDIVVMFWNLGVSGLTLIPAWTSNHVPSKVCDKIIHPFSTFKGPAVEVWE